MSRKAMAQPLMHMKCSKSFQIGSRIDQNKTKKAVGIEWKGLFCSYRWFKFAALTS